MTVEAIQELVARTISQEIKVNVSNNIIIPICGKLASDVSCYCNDNIILILIVRAFLVNTSTC